LLAATALEASGMMPARMAEGTERAEVVRAAVAALSERQRMALMLSRFENMSYVEIGETMGLSTKAVKSLLSRARVNLKEILQPYIDAGVIPSEVGRDNFDQGPTRQVPSQRDGTETREVEK
jgi:RNA polymerase sigma-70 factor (ECF subfamily)